jgi:ribonuclease P protein component
MTIAHPAAFPKELRLRRRAQFQQAQQHGRRIHTTHFLVFVLRAQPAGPRFGITTSRKVGSAVVRNRIKRHLREVFRHRRAEFPADSAVVVVAKRVAAELGAAEVDGEIRRAARRLW